MHLESRQIQSTYVRLVMEVIEKVGPGGQYLNELHTMQNFRSVFYPSLFSRKMNNPETSEIRGKIREKIQHILDTHEVPKLDEAVLAELDKWQAKYEVN